METSHLADSKQRSYNGVLLKLKFWEYWVFSQKAERGEKDRGQISVRESPGRCLAHVRGYTHPISHHQTLPALPLLLLLLLSTPPPCAPQASGIRGDGKQPPFTDMAWSAGWRRPF